MTVKDLMYEIKEGKSAADALWMMGMEEQDKSKSEMMKHASKVIDKLVELIELVELTESIDVE